MKLPDWSDLLLLVGLAGYYVVLAAILGALILGAVEVAL